MNKNYYRAIKKNFPQAVFTLRDDGTGAYIETWSHPSAPKPDLRTLEADAISEEAIAKKESSKRVIEAELADRLDAASLLTQQITFILKTLLILVKEVDVKNVPDKARLVEIEKKLKDVEQLSDHSDKLKKDIDDGKVVNPKEGWPTV